MPYRHMGRGDNGLIEALAKDPKTADEKIREKLIELAQEKKGLDEERRLVHKGDRDLGIANRKMIEERMAFAQERQKHEHAMRVREQGVEAAERRNARVRASLEDREGAIRKKEKELNDAEGALGFREADFAIREAALKAKEGDLEARERVFEERKKEWRRMEDDLREKVRALEEVLI
jgi:hypothetical protein